MIRSLFARLTEDARRGEAGFARLVAIARRRHWYVEGQVPDTINGRFAVLATVVALELVRLERSGEVGRQESVALTERFVEAMDSEHREMGVGDPALGRTVRRLVGALARRVELWRAHVGRPDWAGAGRQSLYRDAEVDAAALAHSVAELRDLWDGLGEEETA